MTPRRPGVPAAVMAERLVVARGLIAWQEATGTSNRDIARSCNRNEKSVREWRTGEKPLPSYLFDAIGTAQATILRHYIRLAQTESHKTRAAA